MQETVTALRWAETACQVTTSSSIPMLLTTKLRVLTLTAALIFRYHQASHTTMRATM